MICSLRAIRLFFLLGLALFVLATAGGCISTTSDNSDLPWNTPPPWEGVPTIPGLSTP